MSQPPTITPQQQAFFAISFFASPGGHIGPDLEERAYQAILTRLANAAPTIGQWSVVWGPSVVQFASAWYAINTMYVAQSAADPAQYVIAIAGTNPSSAFDWLIEDLLVRVQVPWVYALSSAPAAKIALGTAAGLTILQNMKPSGTRPGAGTSLTDWLQTITGAGAPLRLMVTGHSLGGALSPTLALWLADTQGIPGLWDPARRATIATMPTAGPTAGNSAFAAYSDQKLGDRVARFNNSLDVVPHAWNLTTLTAIPALYEPKIPVSELVNSLVEKARQAAQNGDYTPIQASAPDLPGQVDATLIKSPLAFVNFLMQAGYQHVNAYYPWFHFDPNWWSEDSSPDTVFEAVATAVRPALEKAHVVARRVPIGLELVDAPASAQDPRTQDIVQRLMAELRKHGAPA